MADAAAVHAKIETKSSGLRAATLDLRLLLHEEVMKLRKKHYSYTEIIARVDRKHHVKLTKPVISYWVLGKHSPGGGSHLFAPKPTPDLAYVIGAETGDASLNAKIKNYQYRVRLKAKDREFVEEFDRAVSAVLNCSPHRLWRTRESEFYVEIGSYLLYKFLQRPLEELKPFIEHCKKCAAAFVRGFFDSEGSMAESGALTAYNTNVELLRYVQSLLFRFLEVETTGPRLKLMKGSILTRRGKSYIRNFDCFVIYVRRRSLARFYEIVGLTIRRKRLRLEREIGVLGSNVSPD